MKKMLNTLYVTSEDVYVSLDGEVVLVNYPNGEKKGIPIHTLDNIVIFSYKGASPALMGKCEKLGKTITFFSPYGKYLATVGAATIGNILLKRKQYNQTDENKLKYSKNFILGKLYNSKGLILRFRRDHPLQVDPEKLKTAVSFIENSIDEVRTCESLDSLRGIEGFAAYAYFDVFSQLILQRKDTFVFNGRNKRPPTDCVNALLSFSYTLLANECASAIMSVGLDPYAGFMHCDRPGRKSLALDLMEELRSVVADRFVLSLINNRVLDKNDFSFEESGAVKLKKESRNKVLAKWQERKRMELTHPFLKEKVTWGMIPYAQAMLLARTLRGDLEQYPPFFWR